MHARRRGRAPGPIRGARRRRSNRPGNSQAKGLRAEGRSGKQRAGVAAHPLTEGVSPSPTRTGWVPGESLRVHDRGGIGDAVRVRSLPEVPGCLTRAADAVPAQEPRRSSARRSTRCTSRSAPAWCRSPATRCRCSIRPASWPSICTPAPRPGCSTSRIWASCGSPAPIRPRALEALVPGDIRALGPMRMRYTLLLNDAGGILDDLMATRLGDGLFAGRQRRTEGGRSRPSARRISAAAPRSSLLDDRALLALQGPAAAAVLARLAGGVARLPFMSAAEIVLDGRRVPRHPLRLYRRGRVRDLVPAADALGTGRASARRARSDARSASAPAIRCVSKPGCAFTATTSTRPRPRSRPTSPGPSASGGAPKAAFPAPRSSCASSPEVPARKRVGIRPDGRAPAREATADRRSRRQRRSAGSPAAALAPRSARPIAMGYVEAAHAAAGAAAVAAGARLAAPGARRAAAVCPAPLSPPPRTLRRRKIAMRRMRFASPKIMNGFGSTATSP